MCVVCCKTVPRAHIRTSTRVWGTYTRFQSCVETYSCIFIFLVHYVCVQTIIHVLSDVRACMCINVHTRLLSPPCNPKALVAYYYRSKHSDGACRQGPVMVEETNPTLQQPQLGAAKESSDLPPDLSQANRWLQVFVFSLDI
jgi:hypothetical protein